MKFDPDNPRTRHEDDEEWLDYRFKVFERTCKPAMAAQTFKDFDWY
ncbi:MAG: glycosyltransferase, partial [Candidatus Thorarchaeota archaeon]